MPSIIKDAPGSSIGQEVPFPPCFFSLHKVTPGVGIELSDPKTIDKEPVPSAVWGLDPKKTLHYASDSNQSGVSLDAYRAGVSLGEEAGREELFRQYFDPEKWRSLNPLPILPSHAIPRVVAQQSRFTLHGMTCNRFAELINYEIEKGLSDPMFLHPIVVTHDVKLRKRMRRDLFGLGINPFSLFPDLEGLRAFNEYGDTIER